MFEIMLVCVCRSVACVCVCEWWCVRVCVCGVIMPVLETLEICAVPLMLQRSYRNGHLPDVCDVY